MPDSFLPMLNPGEPTTITIYKSRPNDDGTPNIGCDHGVFANAVIDQLALPWASLFRAIEGAAFDKVVLIAITPDARSGTVEIVGETTDREAMIDYVKRLDAQPQLRDVYLLSHQFDRRGGIRPYRFTVSGSWLDESRPDESRTDGS